MKRSAFAATRVGLVLFFICVVFSFGFRVDEKSRMIMDSFDRQALFHGVNAVYKVFPYVPSIDGFNPNTSLSLEDAINLRKWGFNMVRLYVSWPGVEIACGQYNDTYLGEIEKIIGILSKNGIYTLLDCHQDVFSRYYCGEGIPDFYVRELHTPTMKFPEPLPFKIQFDQKNYPNIGDCLKHDFAEYYLTDAVSEGFQELYRKGSSLNTGFMNFWSHVSDYFKNEEGVIGYELLNEPWLGDIYKDPLYLLESGKSDRELLIPFYKDLFERIQENDKDHLVFFEPVVTEFGKVGFNECPFDDISRCVFAYHVYCGVVDKKGAPKIRVLCDFIDDYFIDLRTKDWERMGTGVFVTEFGALYNNSKSVTELEWVINELEKRMTSWSYWQFKYYNDYTTMDDPASAESFYDVDGSLEISKVKALSRTFAPLTCGLGKSNSFDPETSRWEYAYIAKKCVNNAPTVIFLNEEMNYPNGYSIEIHPEYAGNITSSEKNYLLFKHSNLVSEGTEITLLITKK